MYTSRLIAIIDSEGVTRDIQLGDDCRHARVVSGGRCDVKMTCVPAGKPPVVVSAGIPLFLTAARCMAIAVVSPVPLSGLA